MPYHNNTVMKEEYNSECEGKKSLPLDDDGRITMLQIFCWILP